MLPLLLAPLLAAGELGELALPSAKQLDFQTNHEKGCERPDPALPPSPCSGGTALRWALTKAPCGAGFFHFGINTFTGQEHGTGDEKQPPSKFTAPADLDTDQFDSHPLPLPIPLSLFPPLRR